MPVSGKFYRNFNKLPMKDWDQRKREKSIPSAAKAALILRHLWHD